MGTRISTLVQVFTRAEHHDDKMIKVIKVKVGGLRTKNVQDICYFYI